MSRIEQFKAQLTTSEAAFLVTYEDSINELLTNLERDGFLITEFTEENIERIKKFIVSSNSASHLYNNFNKTITSDRARTNLNVAKLSEIGWKIDTIGNQFATVMCHMYQVMAERLKLHLVTAINFTALGLSDADKKPLGSSLYALKQRYNTNTFINYLNTDIRNAVTHYTYFFSRDAENGYINLCNGYFDTNPRPISLADFMKESKRLNILVEGFFLIFMDKIRPGGSMILDN